MKQVLELIIERSAKITVKTKLSLNQTISSSYRSRQTEQLKTQIHILKTTIDREEERANLLEVKCKMFNFGEFQVADEDMTLNKLNKKVEDVYGFVLTCVCVCICARACAVISCNAVVK